MNLLIDSKLCVTPHRILIDYEPDSDGAGVTSIVIREADSIAVQPRRRSSRRAYRSAPAIETVEP
jgi:hypothetical protein